MSTRQLLKYTEEEALARLLSYLRSSARRSNPMSTGSHCDVYMPDVVVHLGLGTQGCEAERLGPGLPSGIKNARFHHVQIGSCGQLHRKQYCDLHEKFLLVIWFQQVPP